MIGRSVLLSLLCIALLLSRPAETAPIRVLLLQNLTAFTISVPPEYSVLTQPAGLMPAESNQRRVFQVQASTRALRLPEQGLEVDEVRLVPRTKEAVIY